VADELAPARVAHDVTNPHGAQPGRLGQDVIRGQKGCTKCRRMLPLEQFAPKPRPSSGHDSWCRSCRNAYLREWRAQRKAAT